MDHLAIMKKESKLLSKIINGEKTIESRWYKSKKAPFDRIQNNDIIYFKNSSEKVTVKATVSKFEQFSNLTEQEIFNLLHIHEKELGVDANQFFYSVKNKKYAIFVYLEKAEKITPFEIDKTGFGSQTSWITTQSIDRIIKRC